MLQVKKVIGELLSSNMYVLFEEGESFCWLVDVGDGNALLNVLPKDIEVRGIFLTHGHFDHIGGLNLLVNRYPKAIVYTSEYGREQLLSDKKNFSLYHNESFIFKGPLDNIQLIQEGMQVPLFNDSLLNVMETPGHCISCLTYYTNRFVFSGDSFIPGVKVVTKLPKGNKVLAQLSKERILTLAGSRTICAGHDRELWQSLFS